MAAITALAILALASAPALADQVQNHEWWLKSLHVTRAWEGSQGAGAVVALLDTGVDPAQPDLVHSVVSGPGYTNSGRLPGGPFWGIHGTEMASLIAGHGHGAGSADGIVGIAPKAKVLSVRVTLDQHDPLLSDPGIASGLPHAIARGIRYAVRHGADVIDLPLDPVLTPGAPGAGGSAEEQSAVKFALAHHVVLVAPAGDDATTLNTVNYPAAYHGVISVGAFGKSFTRAPFSSSQSYVRLTAAGAGMVAATPGGEYVRVNSTSAASAVVSGIVALIRAQFPKLSVAQVNRALIEGVGFRHRGGAGYGTADAAKALAAATKIYESLPEKTSTSGQQSTVPTPPTLPAGKPVPNDHLGRTLVIDAAIAAGVFVCLLGLILAVGALWRRRARAVRLAQVRAATAPPSSAKKKKKKKKKKRQQPSLGSSGARGLAPAAAGSLTTGRSRAASTPVSQDPFGPRSTAAAPSGPPSQPPDEITLAPMSPPPGESPAAAVFGLPSTGAKPAPRATGDTEAAFPTSSFSPSPGSTGESRNLGPAGGARTGTVQQPKVSGKPPWDPAPQPDSELPWTQPPTPGPVPPEAGTPPPKTPDPVLPDLGTLDLGTPGAQTPAAQTPAAQTPAAQTPAAQTPAAQTPGPGWGESLMPPSPGRAAPAAPHLTPDADTGSWEAVAQDVWPGGPRTAPPCPPAELAGSPGASPASQGTENGAPQGSFISPQHGPASIPQVATEPTWPAADRPVGTASPQGGDRQPPSADSPTRGRPPWEIETWQPVRERPATLPPPAPVPPPMTARGAAPVTGTAIPGTAPGPRRGDAERAGAGSGPRSKEAASASSGSQPRTSGSGSPSPLPRRVVRHRQDARPGAGPRPGHGQFVPSNPSSDLFTPSRPSSGPPPLFPPVPPAQANGPFGLQAGESTETFAALPSEERGGSFQPGEREGENEKTETFPAIGPDEPGDR
jgi:Subtilase family